MEELINIQSELKAKKSNFNKFGKYNYRSAEDVLEAVKPLLKKYNCVLTINDSVLEVGGYVFINSTAEIVNTEGEIFSANAQAGIEKAGGMALPQAFGSASSYAKKYALGNLFLLDDTADADATNSHSKEPVNKLTKEQVIEKIKKAKNKAEVISLKVDIFAYSLNDLANEKIKSFTNAK